MINVKYYKSVRGTLKTVKVTDPELAYRLTPGLKNLVQQLTRQISLQS